VRFGGPVIALTCGALSCLAGCSAILGIDDLVADRDGGAASGSGSGSGGACNGTCGTPGCAACPDTTVVVVEAAAGTFAIDRYEVTNADYAAFLATNPSLGLGLHPECDWNDSFQPGAVTQSALAAAADAGLPSEDPTVKCQEWANTFGGPELPVACVDWCDASAYCAWAGKRLCGRFQSAGGGQYLVTDGPGPHADPATSEWFAACSGSGATDYPYGDPYEMLRCNDKVSGTKKVGSFAKCEGGYPGIFDMSGNVGEWDNACTDYNDPDVLQNCLSRGGSWYEGMLELRCDTFRDLKRHTMGDGVGFRCCSDSGG